MKSITSRVLAALVAGVVAASTASAQTYSTCYSFIPFGSCADPVAFTYGSGGNTATLTFTGQAVTTVTAPTFLDFGTVQVTGVAGTGFTFDGTQTVFMRISQTAPSGGSAIVGGLFSGGITSTTSSTAIINWNSPSRFATIGVATYEVERLTVGLTPINASSTGAQTIRGFVTVVPEPSTVLLMSAGLAGLGFFGFRRKKNA